MTVAFTVSIGAAGKWGTLGCICAVVVGSISMAEMVTLLGCGHEVSESKPLRIGVTVFCLKCHSEQIVTHRVHVWTIKCIHIGHSMTRNYGINKEYAVERALAHTRKYGPKHICMVYKKVDFDGTMEVILPNPNQLVIELDDKYESVGTRDEQIQRALGIIQETFPETEEIPF